MLAAFLGFATTATSPTYRTYGIWLFFFFFPILGILGIVTLGPFMRRTQQRKQNWLNEYGWHVLAPIASYPEENAFIVCELSSGGRHPPRYRYVNWQDPETGYVYAFPVNTRFFSALEKLPEGSLHPVWFDPEDPSFFIVSTERR